MKSIYILSFSQLVILPHENVARQTHKIGIQTKSYFLETPLSLYKPRTSIIYNRLLYIFEIHANEKYINNNETDSSKNCVHKFNKILSSIYQ